ncbi:MAG TPA: hypothetical protein DD377_01440 [Firmicutes bacterium]|nr:hypothetical protein [Bacillota bacterium]
MKKQTKLTIFGLGATLLFATTIGANYALNNTTVGNVNGADETNEYTLTLNKDTSDAFKTGWNGEIFTVNTTLGNPIRFRRVTTNSKGGVTAGTANTTDPLDMTFKEGSTYSCLFALDPIQSITAIKANYERINGSKGPNLRFYQANEPFTEKSSFEDTSTNNLMNNVAKTWGFGTGQYLALRFTRSGSGNDIQMVLSSLDITYTCA